MLFLITIPILMGFLISALSGPSIIPWLKRLKIGQTERKEGVASHQTKTGTPVMGGIIFLISFLCVSLFFVKNYPLGVPIIIMTFGFGAIGFVDDYIKVVLKRAMGLRAWQKMGLQVLLTAGFAYYMSVFSSVSLDMRIPFLNGNTINLGWFNIVLLFIVVLGTVNGANFTDGIDGLASSVTSIMAIFLLIVSLLYKGGVEPFISAMIGAIMGFLIYNFFPAKVFMGDTGSLALGGFVVSTAYMLQLQLFIPIIAFIYLAEVVSVILQVGYFKITHGKRIFKMAPLHHHYELCGWSETKVVGIFSIVTVLLGCIALAAL